MSLPGIKHIRLKEPFIVRPGEPHPIREVERQLGGQWVCETLTKAEKKAMGLKGGCWGVTGYIEVYDGVER